MRVFNPLWFGNKQSLKQRINTTPGLRLEVYAFRYTQLPYAPYSAPLHNLMQYMNKVHMPKHSLGKIVSPSIYPRKIIHKMLEIMWHRWGVAGTGAAAPGGGGGAFAYFHTVLP
jgi:hypothetical protein